MRIKTFYARTMAAAMQEIKAHLGPEALILSTKEIPGRSGGLRAVSGFEVVAASDPPDSSGSTKLVASSAQPDINEIPAAAPSPEPLVYSPATLLKARSPQRKKIPSRRKPTRSQRRSTPHVPVLPAEEGLPFGGALSLALYQELLGSGVHEWLARRLVADAQEAFALRQRRTRPALLRAISQVMEGMTAAPSLQDGLPGKRVVVLAGPPGVGKTTSLAKLAARLALQRRKKVALMTLDGSRIGAVEQLRTYAGIMGIPFRFISRVADLPTVISENSQRDYILIDTAGRGPRDAETLQDLASFVRESAETELHLVLSATAKAADLDATYDRFEICRPDHLFFTKVDETLTLGPILNQLVRSRKSLSYYTDGQRVPEDLHPATKDQLLDIVLHKT